MFSRRLALFAAVVWFRSARVKPAKPIGTWRLGGTTDGLQELATAVQRQSVLSGKAALLAAGAAVSQAAALVLGAWRS